MTSVDSQPIRVVVVDDDHLMRVSFQALIDAQKDMRCVGIAPDGDAGVSLVRELAPDVVIMDIQMPHCDGIEATRRICADHNVTRVVMLTTFDVEANLYSALRVGASGFLAKDCLADEMLHAIRVAHRGDSLISPHLVNHLVRRAIGPDPAFLSTRPSSLVPDLTEREREITALVARGLSNAEISLELHLTRQTVKTYVSRLLAKVGCRDRAQLVIFAYQYAIV
jgi:DNA-binding NarL/FixJ family response regulator